MPILPDRARRDQFMPSFVRTGQFWGNLGASDRVFFPIRDGPNPKNSGDEFILFVKIQCLRGA
jgi:hypothetical protein